MRTHRIILGWLFAAVAMLLIVFVVFAWKKAFSIEGMTHDKLVIEYSLAVAALFSVVGLTLIVDYRHSAWICLPFSVVLLLYFPLGTLLGGYYVWYFWRYIYQREKH